MFIVALIVGPLLGLLGGRFLFRSDAVNRWVVAAVSGLVLLFLLFSPTFDLELKLGLITGILVGWLLSLTPMSLDRAA
jgi:hypothetical protein